MSYLIGALVGGVVVWLAVVFYVAWKQGRAGQGAPVDGSVDGVLGGVEGVLVRTGSRRVRPPQVNLPAGQSRRVRPQQINLEGAT